MLYYIVWIEMRYSTFDDANTPIIIYVNPLK